MPILIVIVVVFIILVPLSLKWQKGQQAEELAFAADHPGWDVFVSQRERSVFAVSGDGSKMAIGFLRAFQEWDLALLSSVEIEKNGQSAIVTNRGSQVVGAAVGGLLLGPFGLLVGSVTGSKRQNERVNQLALKVIIDHPKQPVHRVVFFKSGGKGASVSDPLLRAGAERLEHFHAVLSNSMKAQASGKLNLLPAQVESAMITDKKAAPIEARLAALWDLKLAGALTDEEFLQQKTRLLAG